MKDVDWRRLKPPGSCYKCNTPLEPEERICCNCIDSTDGRNQHFWKIKDEDDG